MLQMCAKSPLFAQYQKDENKASKQASKQASSLGAGHATHGFAQLYSKSKCHMENIPMNGKMNKQKCYDDPRIERATEVCLEFN